VKYISVVYIPGIPSQNGFKSRENPYGHTKTDTLDTALAQRRLYRLIFKKKKKIIEPEQSDHVAHPQIYMISRRQA